MQDREDQHRHASQLVPGDLVLVNLRKHETASLHPRGTLAPHFTGPFKVIRAMSENAYKLELSEHLLRAKVHDVFNISHLRTYHSTTQNLTRLTTPTLKMSFPKIQFCFVMNQMNQNYVNPRRSLSKIFCRTRSIIQHHQNHPFPYYNAQTCDVNCSSIISAIAKWSICKVMTLALHYAKNHLHHPHRFWTRKRTL